MHSCSIKRNKGPGKSPWNLDLKGRPSERKGKKKKQECGNIEAKRSGQIISKRRSGQSYQMMVERKVGIVDDLMCHYILLPELRLSLLQLLGGWAAKKFQLTPPLEFTCRRITGFPGVWVVYNLPAKQEMLVQSLSLEDPLEKNMATRCSLLSWEISWNKCVFFTCLRKSNTFIFLG